MCRRTYRRHDRPIAQSKNERNLSITSVDQHIAYAMTGVTDYMDEWSAAHDALLHGDFTNIDSNGVET
jgi:hypothetical protein